jgi:hypothetical protein
MPAETANGWPYPTPSDAVSNTDLQIKELAEALQEKIQAGQFAVTVTASDNGSAVLTFPVAYPAAPNVVAAAMNSFYEASVTSITATQATIHVRQLNAASATATIQCQWFAVP